MLFYKKMQRRNPQDPEAPKKWYAVLRTTRVVEEKEVVEMIADETTLNPMEAKMAMYQLKKILIQSLRDGKTVKLDDIGTFRLTARCKGVDNEDEVTSDIIQKLNIRFLPAIELKDAIARSKFTSFEGKMK